MHAWIFLILFVFLLTYINIISVNGVMKLSPERRLDDMLVYVSENVPEGGGSLIQNIKSTITEASKSLYEATSNMAKGKYGVSFGDIYITVPKNWKESADPITWQQCLKADLKIVTKPLNGNSDAPFTKQLKECGQPGEFSRFPDSFFKANDAIERTSKGKKLMREFVKLRYGVFNEEPLDGRLYAFAGKNFIQSSCPHTLNWNVSHKPVECSDKNKKCRYSILPGSGHNYSVIFDPVSPSTRFFCNDHSLPHNKLARNEQNKKCKLRSITSVIEDHADFRTEGLTIFKPPRFQVLKALSRRIVLVIDTSGSMWPVANKTRMALAHFVNYTIEDGAEIGIVTFGDEATIQSPLLVINQQNKNELIIKIEDIFMSGATNIGDGLMKGVEVLGGNILTDDKLYGTIILLSDGVSNENTTIDYPPAIDNVIRKGIVTHTISYGDIADPDLNRLSKATGGMFMYVSNTSSESELLNKFAVQKSCDPSESKQQKTSEGKITLDSKGITNVTYIDSYVGKDTQIVVDVPMKFSKDTFQLMSPGGQHFLPINKKMNADKVTLIYKIWGKATVGMYTLKRIPYRPNDRYRRSISDISMKFEIFGIPRSSLYNPSGSLSRTFIEVVNASTYVTATIDLSNIELQQFININVEIKMTDPKKMIYTWKMTDGGWGDDFIERDGIFTRTVYGRRLNKIGFYQFVGNVEITNRFTAETIKRTIEMESVRVMRVEDLPIQDFVPPATIQNLQILSVDQDLGSVQIQFTVPGDDSLTGRINKYEVKVNSTIGQFQIKFRTTWAPLSSASYTLDGLQAAISKDDFKMCIRGIDPAGNKASWSEWTTWKKERS